MYAVATTWSSDHLVLPEAEGQLHRAILSSHIRLTMSEKSAIEAVTWSPDGNWLATGTEDGRFQIWNAATGKEMLTQRAHDYAITSISWSPDGKHLATGSEDQTVKVWDRGGNNLRTLVADKGRVNCVAWNPDGKRLAAGCWHGNVKVWDANTGEELTTLVAGEGYIASLAWNQDGDHIALGSGGGEVSIWSVREKARKLSLGDIKGPCGGSLGMQRANA
jgi:WD40 repeat protein